MLVSDYSINKSMCKSQEEKQNNSEIFSNIY